MARLEKEYLERGGNEKKEKKTKKRKKKKKKKKKKEKKEKKKIEKKKMRKQKKSRVQRKHGFKDFLFLCPPSPSSLVISSYFGAWIQSRVKNCVKK